MLVFIKVFEAMSSYKHKTPPTIYRTESQIDPNSFRGREAGMITPRMARRLGVAAFVGTLFLAPPFMGFVAGAADPPPHIMTGEMAADPEVKKEIEIVETNTKRELYVADATMRVTAANRFDGHPFEQNLEWKDILSIPGFTINLNLVKTLRANEVLRQVHYGWDTTDFTYSYDPNKSFVRSGGDEDDPAITVDLDMGAMKTIVSHPPDIRDNAYSPTTDGLSGYWSDLLQVVTDQKAVKNVIGEGAADGLDVSGKLDNLLRGALDAEIDTLVATSCLEAGADPSLQPVIKTLLVNAIKKAVMEDFAMRYKDLPTPDMEDIEVNLKDIQPSDSVTMLSQDNQKKAEALQKILSKPYDIILDLPLIGQKKIPVRLNLALTESEPVQCTVTPRAQAGAKGEE